MQNRERKYYIIIFVIVLAYLIATFFIDIEPLSKRITTITALVSAVAFWLQFKRAERLNESNFIMNLNNQFIGNKDMTRVEHELELFYNTYEAKYARRGEKPSRQQMRAIPLGLEAARESEDCQKLINYLVYLESLAALIDNNVLHLNVIDDLFAYRFFLAVNNPIVQERELLPYSDYYQGCFRLSRYWTKMHNDHNIRIPMQEFSLAEIDMEDWKKHNSELALDISFADPEKDSIQEIAECLYNTDPFIYPAAFGNDRDVAVRAITKIIEIEDSLFSFDNIYVTRYNGSICGICLLADGSSKWETQRYFESIKDMLPSDNDFEYTSKEYFVDEAERIRSNEVEIVACSVAEDFRRRKVARSMLRELAEEPRLKGKALVLEVLADNVGAIELYKQAGFEKTGETHDGFNKEGLYRPDCITMKRNAVNN